MILFKKIKDWKFNKRMEKQRKKRGFSNLDCWSMVDWFQTTFPKMIITLRDMKHGAPDFEFEEFEQFPLEWIEKTSHEILEVKKKKGYDEELILFGSEKFFDRWMFVLSRIAYCLKESSEDCSFQNEFEKEYFEKKFPNSEDFEDIFEPCDKDENGETTFYTLKENKVNEKLEKSYYDKEIEKMNYRESMKNEAFDLLKKYFFNLWD